MKTVMAAVALAGALAAVVQDAGPRPQRPCPVEGSGACVALTGPSSAVEESDTVLARTTEEWVALWARHAGREVKRPYDFFHNKAGVPEVDFARFMVLGVFAGATNNCAGYSCRSAAPRDDVLVVDVEPKSYQTGPTIDDVTPFAFFVLPRTEGRVHVDETIVFPGGSQRMEPLADFAALAAR
jgi:hypothetical protein